MMKYILLSCALACVGSSFSQSKKKRIERLEHQLDSISLVNSELAKQNFRVDSVSQRMDYENDVLRSIMKGYIYQIDTLVQINLRLEQKLDEQSGNTSNSTYRTPEIDVIRLLDRTSVPQQPSGNEGVESGVVSSSEHEDVVFDESLGAKRDRSSELRAAKRTRYNDVKIDTIETSRGLDIVFKLSIDEAGNVVACELQENRSSTDEVLIHKIGAEIMEQVKYKEKNGAAIEYRNYRFIQDAYSK